MRKADNQSQRMDCVHGNNKNIQVCQDEADNANYFSSRASHGAPSDGWGHPNLSTEALLRIWDNLPILPSPVLMKSYSVCCWQHYYLFFIICFHSGDEDTGGLMESLGNLCIYVMIIYAFGIFFCVPLCTEIFYKMKVVRTDFYFFLTEEENICLKIWI